MPLWRTGVMWLEFFTQMSVYKYIHTLMLFLYPCLKTSGIDFRTSFGDLSSAYTFNKDMDAFLQLQFGVAFCSVICA